MTRGAIYRREEGDRGDDEALVSQRHSGWRDGPPRRRGHVRTVTFTYVILPTLMRSRTRWELKRFTNSNVFQFDSCGDLLRMNSTSIWGFKKKIRLLTISIWKNTNFNSHYDQRTPKNDSARPLVQAWILRYRLWNWAGPWTEVGYGPVRAWEETPLSPTSICAQENF